MTSLWLRQIQQDYRTPYLHPLPKQSIQSQTETFFKNLTAEAEFCRSDRPTKKQDSTYSSGLFIRLKENTEKATFQTSACHVYLAVPDFEI